MRLTVPTTPRRPLPGCRHRWYIRGDSSRL
ncbi:hypothetical protein E2C01_038630 [Portunus trituberculatus]|uniref:Uncharacterized protein n=1 Tax=Portunus trituberculatus TaxID=210409 RepID=A0A5B7FHP2_PORTR|nr:hypothetical protein [Portunus trituberculatus]